MSPMALPKKKTCRKIIERVVSFIAFAFLTATFLYWILYNKTEELNLQPEKSVEISNRTVLSTVYIEGRQCIVMESPDHGAISCNWGRNYRDNQ